ncbi:HD-GYP domain-containing protein [Geothermobacter hydrogeniphilus]|uniref:HD-GYP domain-containing protein n=1 Tax=Geothermobacter hydrogeniphilus TaxID=1969733 RepID=A0A2K2HAV9_9BACT|nr:HD domain-containing phosphohydrolase [Geothermobacter hydrogeniphilus]PNU20446.1 HD-GYP domain-containing protein [Geothermobacter hydrogeniphilus]
MASSLLFNRNRLFISLRLRIALVAVGVSLLVGALSYRTTHDDYMETIDSLARQAFGRFQILLNRQTRNPSHPDPEQLQKALRTFSGRQIPLREGRNEAIALYDLRGNRVASLRYPDTPRLVGLPARMPSIAEAVQRGLTFREIAGHPYLFILRPLNDPDGQPQLYAASLFAVSEAAMEILHRRILRNSLLSVAIVLLTAALIHPLVRSLLQQIHHLSGDLMTANLETIQVLGSAIAKRDSDTDIHNYRVTLYAMRLAEQLALGQTQMQELIKGAFLHDIGKIGIHDAILLKPGPLTDEEFAEMKRHVRYGLDIVGRSRWLDDAARVIGNHHEKWDGSGYLQGLSGEEIPVSARIFAIADVFDALSARRPYKEPFPLETALRILGDGRGSHFDPHLLDLFIDLAPELHRRYAMAEKSILQEELRQLVTACFTIS